MPTVSKKLSSAIKTLLRANIGFDISIFALLYIRQLESLEFAVGYNEGRNEKIFSDPNEAINFFMDERARLKMGLDYETEEITEISNRGL